jgi:chloramphenicol-sensitive protein RarD
MNIGIFYAFGALILWGLLPIFWKSIQAVPAFEILCHRMVWSLLFLLIILGFRNHWSWINAAIRDRKILITFLGSASLITINWFTYIWAVNSAHIVEASLGYFINPLVYVVLGVIFLRERLRLFQWIAVGIAAVAVLYLTIAHGGFPWISFILAITFAFYGLIRKIAALGTIEGLTMETAIMFFPALATIVYLQSTGKGSFAQNGNMQTFLLVFAGVVTAFPLLLFAAAARRIDLSALGIMLYIAPTIQFLIGIFVYKESFGVTKLIGFTIIWVALAIYTIDSLKAIKSMKTA